MMNISPRIQSLIIASIWTLLIWLLWHFFVYNIITFKLGLSGGFFSLLWIRKEFIVWLLCAIVWYQIYIQRDCQRFMWQWQKSIFTLCRDPQLRWYFVFVLWLTIGWSLISAWYTDTWWNTYILALRYDFLWFILWGICIYLSQYLTKNQLQSFFRLYGYIIKVMLIFWIFWYMILMIKPGILKLAWYTTKIYEWEVGKQAPAVYYTQQFQWYPRNQFIFERPIHYGFWLTAMWPFFFMLYLKRKSRDKVSFWWIMYAVNIITTFSRAARWVRILQTIVLVVYTYRKNVLFYLKKMIVPLLIGAIMISLIWYQQIIARDYSNTGHINLLIQGLWYVSDHRMIGLWPWSVGPASYHQEGLAFNPENQFIQILIEFGIIWFIWWILLYIFFTLFGLQYRNDFLTPKKKDASLSTLMVIAWSLALGGLAISGLVLHSFVDRMIVLPVMILVWLSIGWKLHHKK